MLTVGCFSLVLSETFPLTLILADLRNAIEGDLKDKLDPADKEALDKIIGETTSWFVAIFSYFFDELSF